MLAAAAEVNDIHFQSAVYLFMLPSTYIISGVSKRLTTVHSSVESLNNRYSSPFGGENAPFPIASKPLV